MRVAGHGLRYEGKALDRLAYWGVRNGEGQGRCECGVQSPTLPTTAARQRWHKKHKAEILRQREAKA